MKLDAFGSCYTCHELTDVTGYILQTGIDSIYRVYGIDVKETIINLHEFVLYMYCIYCYAAIPQNYLYEFKY